MKTKKIIVLGNYPPMLSLISEILSDRGFAVKTAQSNDEVLKDSTAASPDLILVDLDHPDAGRLAGTGQRVVAFSSWEGREGKAQASRLGLQGYIKVNVQTLAEDVRRYLTI